MAPSGASRRKYSPLAPCLSRSLPRLDDAGLRRALRLACASASHARVLLGRSCAPGRLGLTRARARALWLSSSLLAPRLVLLAACVYQRAHARSLRKVSVPPTTTARQKTNLKQTKQPKRFSQCVHNYASQKFTRSFKKFALEAYFKKHQC